VIVFLLHDSSLGSVPVKLTIDDSRRESLRVPVGWPAGGPFTDSAGFGKSKDGSVCPIHRGFIAMSGSAKPSISSTPGEEPPTQKLLLG